MGGSLEVTATTTTAAQVMFICNFVTRSYIFIPCSIYEPLWVIFYYLYTCLHVPATVSVNIFSLTGGSQHGRHGLWHLLSHLRPFQNWGHGHGNHGKQDLDTICADYITPEEQTWEENGVVPGKVAQVPEDLVSLEFTSGTTVLHENRLITTDKVII